MSTKETNVDHTDVLNGKIKSPIGPSYGNNPFTHLFFLPVFKTALRVIFGKSLNYSDSWNLYESQSSEHAYLNFEANWTKKSHYKKYRLIFSLLSTYWLHFLACVVLHILYISLSYTIPFLLPYLIKYLSDRTIAAHIGHVYAAAIFVSGICASTVSNLSAFLVWRLGIRIRSSLITMIYRKSLNLSSRYIENTGTVINMMSNDSQFILDTLCLFVIGICSPIQGVVCITMLYTLIGFYCLVPLAVLAAFILPILYATKYMERNHHRAQGVGDMRVKLISEFISAIKVIKYYAWEVPFAHNIDQTREKQISFLGRFAVIRAMLVTLLQSMPVISLGLTLILYVTFQRIDQSIYTVISYLISLRSIFIFTPLVINFSVQYWVSFSRIQEFLLISEIVPRNEKSTSSSSVIKIKNASFSYSTPSNKLPPTLKNINLRVSRGKFIILTGEVGSGKTSILLAILNELELLEGEIFVSDKIAYVSQEPSIIKASIRDNICFGHPYDPVWFEKVLSACALNKDISLFPNGDLTELFEKGLNLSGGQRQRINLARAVYSRRPLCLMDDPFSALDSQIGEHVFKHVLKLLKDNKCTVVLVSNLLNLLPFSNFVAVVKDGQIVEKGKFSSLLKTGGELFRLTEHIKYESKKKKLDLNFTMSSEHKMDMPNFAGEKILEFEDFIDRKSHSKTGVARGVISKHVYHLYFKSASYLILFFVMVFSLCRIFLSFYQYICISDWIKSLYSGKVSSSYQVIYIALFCSELFFAILMCMISSIYVINGSRNVHRRLLNSILHASSSFYDRVALGHLLSVFSRDISFVDTLLPWQLEYTTNIFINLFTIFLTLSLGTVWSIIISLVGLTFFVLFMALYRILASQGQRLEASSRAPIFNQFSETLCYLPTIRSYEMQDKFVIQNYNNIDRNSSDFLTYRLFTQWFNLIVTQWLNLVIFLVFLNVVILRNVDAESINIEYSLSSLSNTISLLMIAGAFSFNFFEFETRLNSIERVRNCDKISQEPEYKIPENEPPSEWVEHGDILFDNITVSYQPGEPIIKSLTAHILPSEKIGVVGRTGAGKSTLLTTLFRTVELDSGKVIIDNIDISKLGLFDLRSRLSIIPQVPQMFLGSIRYNLDPFRQFADAQLWKILKMVYLDDYVRLLPNQLDEVITENGSIFSIGQSQLISIARCLLRKTKVLLLDEATASLDSKTDFLVQKTIRKLFKNHTVITIAHRLVTIIDSTRVMVLSHGQIIEFDTPKNLLLKKGAFWDMVQATGPEMASHLEDVAFGKVEYENLLESMSSLD